MRAVVTTEPVQKLPQLPTLPKYHTIFLNKHHGTYRTTTVRRFRCLHHQSRPRPIRSKVVTPGWARRYGKQREGEAEANQLQSFLANHQHKNICNHRHWDHYHHRSHHGIAIRMVLMLLRFVQYQDNVQWGKGGLQEQQSQDSHS